MVVNGLDSTLWTAVCLQSSSSADIRLLRRWFISSTAACDHHHSRPVSALGAMRSLSGLRSFKTPANGSNLQGNTLGRSAGLDAESGPSELARLRGRLCARAGKDALAKILRRRSQARPTR
jgi:hypothetical protein